MAVSPVQAAEHLVRLVQHPHGAHLPAGTFAGGLEQAGRRLAKAGALGQHPSDCILDAQVTLRRQRLGQGGGLTALGPVMPVEQAAKFELVINLKTAKALPSVLERADEKIQ
jgi:hypothetical protein